MKSLCEVLDITINDLLNGEKIAEKDLPKYAEKQIADIMLYNQDASKYESAMGIFWALSLFKGFLVGILIAFLGDFTQNLLFAVLIGLCTFLILGLLCQGIITLTQKDKQKN
jgi:F0F1-type ATP synthase assembly protein I